MPYRIMPMNDDVQPETPESPPNVDRLGSNQNSGIKSYFSPLQEFLNISSSIDFEEKIATTRPYIFTSFVAWPMYWLYRGLEWGRHRQNYRLPVYIHRTYLQAKVLQFSIIMTGITVATLESTRYKTSFIQTATGKDDHKSDK